jgi:hypothetical protein
MLDEWHLFGICGKSWGLFGPILMNGHDEC